MTLLALGLLALAAPQDPSLLSEPVTVGFRQPLARHNEGPVLFPVEIDGQELTALLDTGAGRSVILAKTAQDLELPDGMVLPIAGVGGAAETEVVLVESMQVGGFLFEDFAVSVLDLRLHEVEGAGFDLIFGSDLLRQCYLEIDFERQLLAFSPPEWGEAAEDFRFQDLGWAFGVPTVEIQVDERPARFLLDTGNTALTMLNGPYFSDRFEPGEDRPSMEVMGVGGAIPILLGRVPSLVMGGQRFEQHPVGTPAPDSDAGLLQMSLTDGIVGMSLLRHYRLAFDYERNRVGFASGRRWKDAEAGQTGMTVLRIEDELLVAGVVRNSPAQRAGIEPGWEIMKIAGREASSFTRGEAETALEGKAGARVEVRLRDDWGELVDLELLLIDLHPRFLPREESD